MLRVRNTVLIVGLGSLARRLSIELVRRGDVGRIVFVSRSDTGRSWSETCALLGTAAVVHRKCDALDDDDLGAIIREYQPDLVIQCGSLLSPFALYRHRWSEAARSAGFALHLPAQLPIALATMRAVKRFSPSSAVVNCSFPDVTNELLARCDLAPTVGIGNVAIAQWLLQRRFALLHPEATLPRFQVVAHHSQVLPLLSASQNPRQLASPLLFIDGEPQPWNEHAPACRTSFTGEEINIITTQASLRVLDALLDRSQVVNTCAPGPLGLPGGYPVTLRGGSVTLDLPARLSPDVAVAAMRAAAQTDGIEQIDERGRVHFSSRYRDAIAPLSRELCEPLELDGALERFGVLSRVFELDR